MELEEIFPDNLLIHYKDGYGIYRPYLFDLKNRILKKLKFPGNIAFRCFSLASNKDGIAYSTNNADSVYRIDARDTSSLHFNLAAGYGFGGSFDQYHVNDSGSPAIGIYGVALMAGMEIRMTSL